MSDEYCDDSFIIYKQLCEILRLSYLSTYFPTDFVKYIFLTVVDKKWGTYNNSPKTSYFFCVYSWSQTYFYSKIKYWNLSSLTIVLLLILIYINFFWDGEY